MEVGIILIVLAALVAVFYSATLGHAAADLAIVPREDYVKRLKLISKLLRKNKYELFPVVPLKDIEAFEERFGLSLPEDYRWFITNVAGKAKSKVYGTTLVERVDWSNFDSIESRFNVSKPFPLTKALKFVYDDRHDDYNGYPYEIEYRRLEHYFAENRKFNYGVIPINGGGSAYHYLVVNGKEYGKIWQDNIIDGETIFPQHFEHKELKRLTFTDYLQRILIND